MYDFDLRTIEQPSQFANGLKLAADLNSEFNQGIMNFHALDDKDRFDAENTCKLDDISGNPVESPTRKLKYLRRAGEDDDMSDMELNEFVGSNLFDSTRKNCFSPEDLNLLAARRDFEVECGHLYTFINENGPQKFRFVTVFATERFAEMSAKRRYVKYAAELLL